MGSQAQVVTPQLEALYDKDQVRAFVRLEASRRCPSRLLKRQGV
jgi:hypothetical protein